MLRSNLIAIKFGTAEARCLNWALEIILSDEQMKPFVKPFVKKLWSIIFDWGEGGGLINFIEVAK